MDNISDPVGWVRFLCPRIRVNSFVPYWFEILALLFGLVGTKTVPTLLLRPPPGNLGIKKPEPLDSGSFVGTDRSLSRFHQRFLFEQFGLVNQIFVRTLEACELFGFLVIDGVHETMPVFFVDKVLVGTIVETWVT